MLYRPDDAFSDRLDPGQLRVNVASWLGMEWGTEEIHRIVPALLNLQFAMQAAKSPS